MAPNQLPVRANLEQLRRRAKELLKAVRNHDPSATGRVQRHLARPRPRVQLADMLLITACEYGFSSWAKLKAYVEAQAAANAGLAPAHVAPEWLPQPGWRPRRRGPRRTPGAREIQELRAGVVEAARQGAPFPFIFGPPLGPLRSAVQVPLRQALVESGDLTRVVDVLLRGAEHPNPKIRAECAHAMDWLADERCLPALLKLVNDPVPRVRWFALHSLACDECKLTPLPSCPELVPVLTAKATSDPSMRVRRQALYTLRILGVA